MAARASAAGGGLHGGPAIAPGVVEGDGAADVGRHAREQRTHQRLVFDHVAPVFGSWAGSAPATGAASPNSNVVEPGRYRKPNGTLRVEVVHDPVLDHFELVRSGWDGHRRVHTVVFHLDIIYGKIWVQYDATDRPITDELVRAGVPKEDIVLGFQPPERRHLGEFAVA